MNKILPLLIFVFSASIAGAQPWVKPGNGRMKYLDIVAAHELEEEKEGKDKDKKPVRHGAAMEEDEEYQFGRWSWYWKQHLDSEGYIVGGSKNADEWKSFMSTMTGAAAKTTAAANWLFEGPSETSSGYTGLGRVNTIAFDPLDSNILYVGAASGSTWKTENGGSTWKCLYDNMTTLSVSDIKVNPLNGKTIYVATGDADGFSDYSIGVIKSYDGGTSWTNLGPPWTLDSFIMARSLIINPIDTNKLILGGSTGAYKSADGGATWLRVSTLNFRQVLYCPADTSLVYGSVEASGASQIYRSNDGGFTWGAVTTLTGANRINIAVCPAAPGVVKAIATNNVNGLKGIYSSVDFGNTFTPVFINDASCTANLLNGENSLPTSSCNANGWYHLCIAIDPLNENNVLIGGINTYYSTTGGYSWNIATQWWNQEWGLQVVHADKHWMGWNPLNHAAYIGCDGGIYRSNKPMVYKWQDLSNGLGITQFYRNAVDNNASFVLGGAQDNGTKGLEAGVATDLTGGDGMNCLFNYADPENTFYCAYQNGYVDITTSGGASFNSITDDLPTPGAWVTPYILNPTNPSNLLIGYKGVFSSMDNGTSWSPISPNFDPSQNIQVLAMAYTDPNYIYAIRDYAGASKIHYTKNGGGAWTALAAPFPNYMSDLVVDPTDENHFWVTLSGYSAAKVYSYSLTTATWTNESAGLPNIPVNCMVIDSFSKTLYVGTDAAVFYKTKDMTTWQLYNTNLPTVNIFDLNINHRTNELWAATYGRGMWKTPKLELTPNGIPMYTRALGKMTVSPNPCHGEFSISATGVLFQGSAVAVKIIAADGKTVQQTTGNLDSGGKMKVDINTLAPGFYICELSNEKGQLRSKLVVY